MDLSFGLLAAALTAIALGSFAKGITGVGLPILAVPVLASFTSVEEAVVLMVLPGLAANGWLVITHRKWSALRPHIGFLVLGAIGIVLGTWLLSALGDRWLKLVLAAWLGVYLLQYFSKRSYDHYFSGRNGSAPLLGLAAGTIQGAAGISAPIVAPYFHANGLVRETYAFAAGFTFFLLSAIQVGAMSGFSLFTRERLAIGLIVVVPTLLFTHAGIRLSRRIEERAFHHILLVLFVLMELKLLFDIFYRA